jgi:RNA polymerase sigma-70 factor (ECF subfamily)
MGDATPDWERIVAGIYREDRGKVLASLIRLLGSFDAAEEASHDAFAVAVEQWPVRGLPDSPWRWLVSVGRFRAIDKIRRRAKLDAQKPELARLLAKEEPVPAEPEILEDDTLRLIFICCHPELPPDAQVALTLREVCGLTTEEIAKAFLTAPPTVAQRIVRAKTRIHELGLRYEVPPKAALPERLESVLRAIYLIFNEGYMASTGEAALRAELTSEAIRLGRLLVAQLADPEALGLLALMLLQDSRRDARISSDGAVILLPDQDRTRWDCASRLEGLTALGRAFATGQIGSYGLQAAIAAVHAEAATADATDWGRIVSLYDLLLRADPSPVVELNRAVALAMRDGPAQGLASIEAIFARGELGRYSFAYTARGELLRRLGRFSEARLAYRQGLEHSQQAGERRFIEERLAEIEGNLV